MNDRYWSHGRFLSQHGMGEPLLFQSRVRFDPELPTRLCELHRATFALVEMIRADLLAIDERDGQPIRQPRTELFHEVQRQRWAIRPVNVEKTDERIKAHARQRRDAVMPDQSVEKGKQAV